MKEELSDEVAIEYEEVDNPEITIDDALHGLYNARDSLFVYMQYAASESEEELLEDLSIMDNNLNVTLYFLEKMKRGDDVPVDEDSNEV